MKKFERQFPDASISQRNGQSAKAALVCLPIENTHGYEIAHKDSIKNCANLLFSYLSSPI